MDNVLEHIAQHAIPKPAKSHEFNTSRIHSVAVNLFASFSKVENSNKVKCIIDAALSEFTFAEFSQALSHAQSMAKAADRAAGWEVGDKTGRNAYGPKESVFASRASERRQIFGAAKQNIECIVHLGPNNIYDPQALPSYEEALKKSRNFLKENNLTWDGQNVELQQAAKLREKEFDEWTAAMTAVKSANPQNMGESIKEWVIRLGPLVDEHIALYREKREISQANDLAMKFIQKHGTTMSLRCRSP